MDLDLLHQNGGKILYSICCTFYWKALLEFHDKLKVILILWKVLYKSMFHICLIISTKHCLKMLMGLDYPYQNGRKHFILYVKNIHKSICYILDKSAVTVANGKCYRNHFWNCLASYQSVSPKNVYGHCLTISTWRKTLNSIFWMNFWMIFEISW